MGHSIVEILKRLQGTKDAKKTLALPSRRQQTVGRRRVGAWINFYDLGQVNHADPEDDPVWEDHPVLKTPGYSTTRGGDGIGVFEGVTYYVDPFLEADFAAYTDMFFNYPVTEWHRRYRKLRNRGLTETETRTDERLAIIHSEREPQFGVYRPTLDMMAINHIDQTPEDYAFFKDIYLNNLTEDWDYRLAWDQGRDRVLYRRGFDELTCPNEIDYGAFIDITAQPTPGYFGFSTAHKETYKVTATYDFDADDVGVLAPSGQVDVFLMPQVGFFVALSRSADHLHTEIMGMAYQVQPRKLWPRYVDWVTNEGGGYAANADLAAYLDYQISRDGMQGSAWTFTGLVTGEEAGYVEGGQSASLWNNQGKYAIGTLSNNLALLWHPGGPVPFTYFECGPWGGPWGNVVDTYGTGFRSTLDPVADEPFGYDLFRNNDPMLVAVIKIAGQYYYVWDKADIEGLDSLSLSATRTQGVRYMLSRGINWQALPGFFIPPVSPHDGVGI